MKKGFTLVELLAVIVIIGLLMTIAIPAVLTVSKNVKQKSYETKIKMIEDISVTYGEQEKATRLVPRVKDFKKLGMNETLPVAGNDLWVKVTSEGFSIADKKSSTDGIYPAFKVTINDLVSAKQLSYDATDNCKKNNKSGKVNSDVCNSYFNNIVTNPVDDNIINSCYVYIYYKNNRVYSHFDRETCDDTKNYDEITSYPGHEYRNLLA